MENFIIPNISLINLFEIVGLAVIVYYAAKYVQNTRMTVILKGLGFLGGIYVAAIWLELYVIRTILSGFFIVAGITLVIVFNSEIRRFIEQIGTKVTSFNIAEILKGEERKEVYFTSDTIKALADAVVAMSAVKTGALIVLEKDVPVREFIQTGIEIDAKVSSQLLINIFEKNTPLHDGAVVISKNKITAATCILPLTSKAVDKRFGTRHRAAIGASEASDCCVLVVSEETGNITFISNNGQYSSLKDRSDIIAKLKSVQEKTEKPHEVNTKDLLAQKVQRNFSLKFISGIVAVVIWATITLMNDPITSVSFTVPITPVNETVLTERGQIYEMKQDAVKVKVKVRTSLLGEIDSKKIIVEADLSKLSHTYAVPLSATITGLNSTEYDLTLSESSINIILDDVVEVKVPVKVESSGSVASGYWLTGATPTQSEMTIKCGASLAKTLDSVIASVELNESSESFTTDAGFVLKDKNGHVVSSQNYASQDTCEVNVEIKPVKVVPVKVNVNSALQSIYNIDAVEADKTTITVIGNETVLASFNEYVVNIDEIELEDTNAKKIVKIVQVSLPEGIQMAESLESIAVELKITPASTKEIILKPEEIKIKDLNENLKLEIINSQVIVNVYGSEEETSKMTNKNINAYISAKDLTEGQYNLLLQFDSKLYASATTVDVQILRG